MPIPIGAISEQSDIAQRRSTLGRLGGLSPVEADRGERALWLGGNGYRASLFHLGALTRLNELGLLAQVRTVGAVSGGSILAALLATRVPWPLHGAHREWREQVVLPLRAIARRNVRARSLLRKPYPGGEAALEERFARELVDELGGESQWGPNFVFGASGLTLGGLTAGWEECVEWEIERSAHPPGYHPALVERAIAAVRTDLDAFGEAEQAILENHGYLLTDAALRSRGLIDLGGIEGLPPEPPHPHWMDEGRALEALSGSSRRKVLGRLRPRRARQSRRSRDREEAVDHDELLERHRPLLQYDSLESLRSDPVSTICSFAAAGRCNSLHRADGTVIASVEPSHGEARLSLEFLGGTAYANGEEPRRGDYLDECGGSHVADALKLRRRGGEDVVYGRSRRDSDGRLWLQYWSFFYCADSGFLGLDQHEGDWQVFQIRVDEQGRPDAATFAGRSDACCLGWEQVELAGTDDGPVVVVRPARGSHAPLPRSGSFVAPVVPDHNDGRGPLARPRLETIADDGPGWVLWPGRWGSTRRREHFEGDSPRGPQQHPCWWDPAELHRESRPWSDAGPRAERLSADRLATVVLDARREEDLAVVTYKVADDADAADQPARIVAASVEAGGEVGVARSFPVEGRRGSIAIQLSGDRDWRGVRACAVSALGAPGECQDAPFDRK
jgi:hypothetical protein